MQKCIKTKSDNCVVLKIQVKPNSRKQEIIYNDDFLTISLRSKPIQNKANKELITLLKKKLNISANQIHIISGIKSPNKVIELTYTETPEEQEILKKLLG